MCDLDAIMHIQTTQMLGVDDWRVTPIALSFDDESRLQLRRDDEGEGTILARHSILRKRPSAP